LKDIARPYGELPIAQSCTPGAFAANRDAFINAHRFASWLDRRQSSERGDAQTNTRSLCARPSTRRSDREARLAIEKANRT
jgi:hypothetical protein